MAILAPAELPQVLKLRSEPIKKYILTKLGHPQVEVELSEDQLEQIVRTVGDFTAGYFPREQRLAVFYTTPLRSTYPLPQDAYWVQEVQWDPVTTNIGDIFSAESYLFNVGNLSGGQGLLLDYHLLQAYRKFSKKVLGTEGHWEVIGEVDGEAKDQLIRLYPTPKGAFPVTVLYYPVVTQFRSPQARKLVYDMLVAEAKEILGNTRRKVAGIPTPDGGSIASDGGDLAQEAAQEKEKILQMAIQLGEPLGISLW